MILIYQDRLYKLKVAKRGPEARLYLGMVIGAPFLPIGAFIYAWTSFPFITFIAPCVGLGVISFSIFIIYTTSFTYLSDSYAQYSSSALASLSISRNLIAGFFPLFTNTFYDAVNFNIASTIIGCAAILLGVTPYILFLYGLFFSYLER